MGSGIFTAQEARAMLGWGNPELSKNGKPVGRAIDMNVVQTYVEAILRGDWRMPNIKE